MSYIDNRASDDLISAIYEQGLDPLFHEGENQYIEPGTPVHGYRFMYESPTGKLYSPFSMLEDRELSLLTENLEQGISIGRSSVDIYENQDAFVESSIQSKDEINKSKTGHGYYYWLDKDKAMDYMKGALLSIEGKQERTTSTVFQVGKEITQDEYLNKEDSTYIAGKRLRGSVQEGSLIPVRQPGSVLQVGDKYYEGSTKQQERGSFVLYEVEGYATEPSTEVQDSGVTPAGYVMDEMKYIGEPLLRISMDEVLKFQK